MELISQGEEIYDQGQSRGGSVMLAAALSLVKLLFAGKVGIMS